jgi:RHH-type proline utilization regulon transcriptional repressor/proline dehydrogenase/delta 1-pyrroline-5-carboxylate dehydrogenase
MGEGVPRSAEKPSNGLPCVRPGGQHRDLLAYLVRRLLENGANSSFVHQLADETVPVDELLISPCGWNPIPSLPLPVTCLACSAPTAPGWT